MGGDNPLDSRKANTRALGRQTFLNPPKEFIKHVRQIFFRDARSLVSHLNYQFIWAIAGGNFYFGKVGGIFDGVVYQVEHHVVKAQAIAIDFVRGAVGNGRYHPLQLR